MLLREDGVRYEAQAVSISPSDLKTAREFIESQESHHEIVSFQCELKAIFDEHGFDYDERELWG